MRSRMERTAAWEIEQAGKERAMLVARHPSLVAIRYARRDIDPARARRLQARRELDSADVWSRERWLDAREEHRQAVARVRWSIIDALNQDADPADVLAESGWRPVDLDRLLRELQAQRDWYPDDGPLPVTRRQRGRREPPWWPIRVGG
jgi:hypothetical protein